MTDPIPVVGAADSALDQRLSDELDAYNAAATPEVEPAQELTTSFTFQAPDFYQRHGYKETFRWESVPTLGRDDVHLRKDL